MIVKLTLGVEFVFAELPTVFAAMAEQDKFCTCANMPNVTKKSIRIQKFNTIATKKRLSNLRFDSRFVLVIVV